MKLILKSHLTLIVSAVLWLFAFGIGARLMVNYESANGKDGVSPAVWPAESHLEHNPRLPTLIMMVQPKCSHSRASLSELARLVEHDARRMNAEVVFIKPVDLAERLEQTDLWLRATEIPGVIVRTDDGTEARRFGSQTSGHVMFYSADGRLLFSGGITTSRGREGDNDGRDSIHSLLTSGSTENASTPVVGCPLFSDSDNSKLGDVVSENQSN